MQALRGRHADVLTGDAAEVTPELRGGAPGRVLAVLVRTRVERHARDTTARPCHDAVR